MKALNSIILIIFLLIGISGFSQEHIRPFQTHNQSPLVHFFGLPTNPGGSVLEANEFFLGNYLNIANSATSAQINEEAIYLDGEMYRNELQLAYGLLPKLELSIQVPIVKHSSGIMDPFISSWHETFNLPGRAREYMQEGDLDYFYMENEAQVFQMQSSELNFGDISFALATPLLNGEYHQLAARGFFKLSIGDKSQLIGSGTNDFGFQFTGEVNAFPDKRQFCFYYSMGYLKVGRGAILSDIVSRNVGFGSLGLAFNWNGKLVPKLQFDFHTGFYHKSIMKQLGKNSMQMSLGADYFVSPKFSITGAFSEDLIVNTSPDFVLHIGISHYF